MSVKGSKSAAEGTLEDAHMGIPTVATASMLMACAGFTACGSVQDELPQTVTTAVTRDFNQGDALRTAANYTDDAEILPPRHPVIEGKPAIAAFFEANIDKYIAFGNDTTWTMVRGDLGIEQGTYKVRNVKVGEDVETGKYIRIWKRTAGGWKLYRDMFSPDSAVAVGVYVSPDEAKPSEGPMSK
jgi:ketosteroid isomerase-like protein